MQAKWSTAGSPVSYCEIPDICLVQRRNERVRRVLAPTGPTDKKRVALNISPAENLMQAKWIGLCLRNKKGPVSVALLTGPRMRKQYFLLSAEGPLCKRSGAAFDWETKMAGSGAS